MVALAACGDTDPSELPGVMASSSESFSEEQKDAARALSVGNQSMTTIGDEPYERAIACTNALDELIAVAGEAGFFSEVQLSAAEEVRQVYYNRALEFGAEQNKSSRNVNVDLQGAASAAEQTENRSLIAIGCIRNLQGELVEES